MAGVSRNRIKAELFDFNFFFRVQPDREFLYRFFYFPWLLSIPFLELEEKLYRLRP